jgi:hypothetical protein
MPLKHLSKTYLKFEEDGLGMMDMWLRKIEEHYEVDKTPMMTDKDKKGSPDSKQQLPLTGMDTIHEGVEGHHPATPR